MKRFHVNLTVADLEKSIEFYNTLFSVEPTVVKDDYAKWMLEDPRINFSVTESSRSSGVNHVGLHRSRVDLADLNLGETFRKADGLGVIFRQPRDVILKDVNPRCSQDS